MSNLDFMKSIIGKPVFALPTGDNHRGKQELKPCVIESVGRKYVKASVSTHKYTVLKKDDHYLKSEYHYDFLIFESEKEYGDYKRAKDLRSKINCGFSYIGGFAEKLSLDQLERINEIISEEVHND